MAPDSYNTIIRPANSFFHAPFDGLEVNTNLQSPAEQHARTPGPQSSSKPPSNHIPFLERLKRLPEVRPSIPWRPGQELPTEKSVDSPRVQQRGATLLSTRGAAMAIPCEHCAGGYGRFVVCVALQNWFQGACSSCIFTSKGNKCSLRTKTSGTMDGRALQYHADDPEPHLQEEANPPAKKRKRSSISALTPPIPQPTPYTSIYPQLDPPRPESPDLDSLLQAEIAREQSSEPESPPREDTEPSQHPSQPNVARPRRPSKGTAAPSTYQFYLENPGHRLKAEPLLPRDAAPMSQKGNETSDPVSATWQSRSSNVQGKPMSVIESLSKAKQRELYGILSQCQGGIDHLQRQLESLKALLGIDDERSS